LPLLRILVLFLNLPPLREAHAKRVKIARENHAQVRDSLDFPRKMPMALTVLNYF